MESSARFCHSYVIDVLVSTHSSRFVAAVSLAFASGATSWSAGSTATDSSFKAGCSEAVTNRFVSDGSDSTPFWTACTCHSYTVSGFKPSGVNSFELSATVAVVHSFAPASR